MKIKSKNSSQTKLSHITEKLRHELSQGKFKTHDLFFGQEEVLKNFEVSLHTARGALGQLENEGLIYRIKGKGAFVAPQPRRKKILIVLPSSAPLEPNIHEIDQILFAFTCTQFLGKGKEEYVFEIVNTLDISKSPNDLIYLYPGIKGLLFMRCYSVLVELEASLKAQGLQYLFYGSSAYFDVANRDGVPISRRINDEEKIVSLALSYLKKAGHRHIVCLHGVNQLNKVINSRVHYYQLEMQALKTTAMTLPFSLDQTKNESSFAEILNLPNRPTAFFCTSDNEALAFINACLAKGYRIPEDFSVIGINDSPFSAYAAVPLTTVRLPIGEDAKVCLTELIGACEAAALQSEVSKKTELKAPKTPSITHSNISIVERSSVLNLKLG